MPSYDVAHLHFVARDHHSFAAMFRSLSNRLIVSVWGSDYYRATAEQKSLNQALLDTADIVTFSNDTTMSDYSREFPPRPHARHVVRRFGLEVLNDLRSIAGRSRHECRKDLSLPADSLIVACGTNGSSGQQHLKILNEISFILEKLPKNIFFLLPMTYGSDDQYASEVEVFMEDRSIPGRILKGFLPSQKLASMRRASDILIQLQTTDQFSGAMQEHLFAGSMVITGEWLPYNLLEESGIHWHRVQHVDELSNVLPDIVDRVEAHHRACIANSNIIWALSSCEATTAQWLDLYEQSN